MKLLLLAGDDSVDSGSLVALRPMGRQIWIDWQIERMQTLGFEIGVVLAGPLSEVILQASRRIQDCDLVYDTATPHFHLLSNLRAGLYSVVKDALALPIFTPCPQRGILHKILHHPHRCAVPGLHIAQPYFPSSGSLHPGYPIYVSKKGNELLKWDDEIDSLQHSSLTVSAVPILDSSIGKVLGHSSKDFEPL